MNLPRGPENLCFDKDEFMKVRGGRRHGGWWRGFLRTRVAGSSRERAARSLGRDFRAPPRPFPRAGAARVSLTGGPAVCGQGRLWG